ncbi:GPP34 family phosphoprotein [Nonomuraea angiospora]|uniref:GOLPH3/VPS74 family protein n=1 Tax=Nonomuraea angiospora TaxID=46172 RepID=UPI00331822EB
MQSNMLIVEDLMLLMLDDETGAIAGAGTLHYTLGGAVLVELALNGRIETDGGRPGLNGPKIIAVGDGPLSDPLLQSAYEKVAERPQRVQPLLLAIGGGLWKPVIDRLVERGLIRRESRRVLGVFRTTRLPAEDTGHEAELRRKVRDRRVEYCRQRRRDYRGHLSSTRCRTAAPRPMRSASATDISAVRS